MWTIDEKEARELCSSLVAIDSVNPSLVKGGAGEKGIAEYILSYFQDLGLPSRLDEVVPGRPNVVAVLPAGGGEAGVSSPGASGGEAGEPGASGGATRGAPGSAVFDARHGLMLNGHTDTVGAPAAGKTPPRPQFKDGKIYGRGSYDMKGGVAMALLAMAALKRSGAKLNRSVLFTGVVDEEYASIGTQDVVRRYKADAAVILEPTSLTVHLAHKGFAWVAVETLGRAAHGSRYEEGVDAIAKMGRVLVAVEELGRRYLEERPHPLVGHRSIHGSLIEGGRELSTYPDHCTVQFERRTLPGEDPAGIVGELEAIVNNLAASDPDFRARITLGLTRPAYEIAPSEKIVQTLVHCFERTTGFPPQFSGSSAWLDSAILGGAGIPTVIFGPHGSGAHADEEYVTLSSLISGARVLAQTMAEFCG